MPKPFPQLKIRTEFTFRKTYAPIKKVAEQLQALGCTAAAIVDPNCWGHVRWAKALKEKNIQPIFGCSIPVENSDGLKPSVWCLAEDTKRFYNFLNRGEFTEESFADAKGIVRFAGDALSDPASFDYIDINPGSLLSTSRSISLHKKTKKPLVITCDNWYAVRSDRDVFLSITDNKMVTPQWILTEKELRATMPWAPTAAFKNAHAVAERLAGIELQKAPMIKFKGDLNKLIAKGKAKRIAYGLQWSQAYSQRVKHEMKIIREKQFESYFIVVADLVDWAKQRMLVGPARGSSAGSLICYLLRITEVDPLVHGLLFERFVDVNRSDLPDIDIDFSDTQRHLVFEYLADKYGQDKVARLGNICNLQSRSLLAECGKRLGIPDKDTFNVKNVLIEYSSGDARYGKGLEDTLKNTGPGKELLRKHDNARFMTDAENHAWHTSIHAAGVLVSNEPITDYCYVVEGVTQLDKKDSEELNLLKIDALGLRTLGILGDAGVLDNEEFYHLPLTDPAAFAIVNDQKFAGIFQFEGEAQRRVAMQIPVNSFRELDHITALARPGPLGGGAANTYTNVNDGKEEPSYIHPSMEAYLGETLSVVLYQEQVMRIVREIGGFSWDETSIIRKGISARKGLEFMDKTRAQFVKGAKKKDVPAKAANKIWDQICAFGAWGMNRSHTCSYAIISYWCCWMKAHHPLPFAAALLRSAKDEEQTIEILRELEREGVSYIPFDVNLSRANWHVADGKLIGGFMNLHGVGPAKAKLYIEAREGKGITEKQLEFINRCPVQYAKLYEAKERWADYYNNPSQHNICGSIQEFGDLEDFSDGVVICKLTRKQRRDENETRRKIRRENKEWPGQSLFLDAFMVDDSVSKPVIVRIKTPMWFSYGEKFADRAVDGVDWFLVRGRWLAQFNMFLVKKIRCLTNEDLFNEES